MLEVYLYGMVLFVLFEIAVVYYAYKVGDEEIISSVEALNYNLYKEPLITTLVAIIAIFAYPGIITYYIVDKLTSNRY